MRISHHIGLLAAALLLPVFGQAGEYAVLTNGFRIHADRHEVEGSRVRLFLSGGVTELAVEEVPSFEQEEAGPTIPAPATPPVATAVPAKDMFTSAAEKHG